MSNCESETTAHSVISISDSIILHHLTWFFIIFKSLYRIPIFHIILYLICMGKNRIDFLHHLIRWNLQQIKFFEANKCPWELPEAHRSTSNEAPSFGCSRRPVVSCSRRAWPAWPVPPFGCEVWILQMHWKHWMRCGSYRPKCIYINVRFTCPNAVVHGGGFDHNGSNELHTVNIWVVFCKSLALDHYLSILWIQNLLKSPVTGRGQCLPSQCSGWSMRQGRPWSFFFTPVNKILLMEEILHHLGWLKPYK